MTTFLKFDSKEQFEQLKEGSDPSLAWDIIGELPTGDTETIIVEEVVNITETDPETGEEVVVDTERVETEVEQPTYHDGWHVNLLGTVPENMEEYVINPTTPSRIFG